MSLFDASDGARRFDTEPVSTCELDEERQRTSGETSERQLRDDKQPLECRERRRNGRVSGSRRPKAGCYPHGFSPYCMTKRGGFISLSRLLIKTDLKVTFCAMY